MTRWPYWALVIKDLGIKRIDWGHRLVFKHV